MLAILLLGFSSGLPLGLTGSTLQAWMNTEHVDLGVIGLFSLVGMPYGLKFLAWAPLMDRYVPPFLGRRRGWLLVTQVALLLSIMALGFSSPREHLGLTALLAVLTAFFSARGEPGYRLGCLQGRCPEPPVSWDPGRRRACWVIGSR